MTPDSGGEMSQMELQAKFDILEARRQKGIAKEIYEVVREINMSKLCDAEKGYIEATLLLVAGKIGSECLSEVKRRLREERNASNTET